MLEERTASCRLRAALLCFWSTFLNPLSSGCEGCGRSARWDAQGTPVFRLNIISIVFVRILPSRRKVPRERKKAGGFCAVSRRLWRGGKAGSRGASLLGDQALEEKEGRKQEAVNVLVSSRVIPPDSPTSLSTLWHCHPCGGPPRSRGAQQCGAWVRQDSIKHMVSKQPSPASPSLANLLHPGG